MKNIVLGVLAHVDAGKTTLTESILLKAGVIKNFGRVDNGDAFLDNNQIERDRGITVFSKQAVFSYHDTSFDLLDTPGHVDFSAEMERTLQVLDYAVLVISGADELFGHTFTLWNMLRDYNIPVFIFINKMDMADKGEEEILSALRKELSEGCVGFSRDIHEAYEDIAVRCNDEEILNHYLDTGIVKQDDITAAIEDRLVFPVYFGSALKQTGITDLLEGLDLYTCVKAYPDELGAKVFKISRDDKGNRLTHIKLVGGTINVRDELFPGEKINQIRIYNGEKYELFSTVSAGRICTLAGFDNTYAGQGIGSCEDTVLKLIEPVLSYELILPDTINERQFFPEIKKLTEELPELNVMFDDVSENIKVMIMGQVQIEILSTIISDRFGFVPTFDSGNITYKETISSSAIGVGHFEPLRHYAEVHLLLEPGKPGSGITVSSDCSYDVLDRNWQRLIMTHIAEKRHKGVLTGSELTDVEITVINGKAHNKHTEGGDFRKATYRAVRQGLMECESILLEPYYSFRLEIPSDMLGKAMTDVEQMHGTANPPEILGERAVLTGLCPVSTMREYQLQVNAYTHGRGNLSVAFAKYGICHNSDEVIRKYNYNPELDTHNPSSSVFCSQGSGFIVPWYDVKKYMHVSDEEKGEEYSSSSVYERESFDYSIGTEEIDEILNKTFRSNINHRKNGFKKTKTVNTVFRKPVNTDNKREKLLIVDGYNVIFAWKELKELSEINLDSAKDRLIQILSNYKGMVDHRIMVVFDGYKVKGGRGSVTSIEDIDIVYTKEDETADRFIEHFTNVNRNVYNITVATSDGLIQLITRGQDCYVVSSNELLKIIDEATKELRDNYNL